MADILIRGMGMPTRCINCALFVCEIGDPMSCLVGYRRLDERNVHESIPSWCPLLPLPDGHGRLIDADDLIDEMALAWDYDQITNAEWTGIREWLNHSPTIVPAEGGGKDV